MQSITPSLVQGWVSKAVQDGLSPRSIRKCHTLLHSIFKAAVRDCIIAYNPSEGTSLPKVISTRRATITPAQFDALLAAIPRQHRALLQVGIETGMRWGELAALRPRHLNLTRATVLVNTERLQAHEIVDQTLTKTQEQHQGHNHHKVFLTAGAKILFTQLL